MTKIVLKRKLFQSIILTVITIVFTSVALLLFTTLIVSVSRGDEFFTSSQLIILLFFLGCLWASISLIRSFFKYAWLVEVLEIDKESFTVNRIRFNKIKKTEKYLLKDISELLPIPLELDSIDGGSDFFQHKMKFYFENKVIRFGNSCSEEEASKAIISINKIISIGK